MLARASRAVTRVAGTPVLAMAPRTLAVAVRAYARAPSMPKHRSNAQELIDKVPPIPVEGDWALCDGGGGPTGHPAEWIKLDKTDGHNPETCKYCGLRYVKKAAEEKIAWSNKDW